MIGSRSAMASSAPSAHVHSLHPAPPGGIIAKQFNVPALADVVFEFSEPAHTGSGGAGGGDGDGVQRIYAHKLVLGLASEVFSTMFSGPTAEGMENASGRAVIPSEYPYHTMDLMLRYLYFGLWGEQQENWAEVGGDGSKAGQTTYGVEQVLSFPSNSAIETACELLQLADYYKLDALKEWIEVKLVEWDIITMNTVCDLAAHAFASNATQVVAVCVHCMRELHDVLKDTEAWVRVPPSGAEQVLLPAAEVKRRQAAEARQQQQQQTAPQPPEPPGEEA